MINPGGVFILFIIFLILPVILSICVWRTITGIKNAINQDIIDRERITRNVCLLVVCCGVVFFLSFSDWGKIFAFFVWVLIIPTGAIAALRLEEPSIYDKVTFLTRLYLALILPCWMIFTNLITVALPYEFGVQSSLDHAQNYTKLYYGANAAYPDLTEVMRQSRNYRVWNTFRMTEKSSEGWIYEVNEPHFVLGYVYKNNFLWFVPYRRICIYNSAEDKTRCDFLPFNDKQVISAKQKAYQGE